MVDPYDFIVRESTVSSSQEEVLKRIPGWPEQQDAGSPTSPSQAPLALSRLCGSGGNSSSREEEEHEPALASAFCVQEPLEWASPEAFQDDSYNPALESDRSQSVSPLAPLHAFGELWASRLITQSQNDHADICDLPLAEEVAKTNLSKVVDAGFGLTFKQQKSRQGTSGHPQNSNPGALSETPEQIRATASRDVKNGSHSFVRRMDCGMAEKLDGDGKLQNNVEPLEVSASDKLGSLADHTSVKKSLNDALDEPAMDRSRSCCIVDNVRKRKDEGDYAFATTAHKVKFPKGPSSEQQLNKLANAASHQNVKGPQSKKQLGADCEAGTDDTKCLLPFVSNKENNTSTHRMEEFMSIETEMVRDNAAMDCTIRRLFPKSIMDVMMLVSEVLPTPGPNEPDFLSIVMSTGVSLPLPFRDCAGHLMSKKSMN